MTDKDFASDLDRNLDDSDEILLPVPHGPSRADVLIENAKNVEPPGRYSLRWMFGLTLLVSCGLALFRALGMFEVWQDYLLFFLGVAYLFAPFVSFTLTSWIRRRTGGNTRAAIMLTVFITIAFLVAMLWQKSSVLDLVGLLVVGIILWTMQAASIGLVRWAIFRDAIHPRTLPEQLPSDATASNPSIDTRNPAEIDVVDG